MVGAMGYGAIAGKLQISPAFFWSKAESRLYTHLTASALGLCSGGEIG